MRCLPLLVALVAFNPKACQRFCERQGYDFCVPYPNDKKAYVCADRVERDEVWERPWSARWSPGAAPSQAREEAEETPGPQIHWGFL